MSRLLIRIETKSGSRIVISHEMPQRDASEIGEALAAAGITSSQTEDMVPVSIPDIMKRRKKDEAKERKLVEKSNIAFLPTRKAK